MHEFQKGAKDLQESLGIDGLDLTGTKEPKQIEATATPSAPTPSAPVEAPPLETTMSAASSAPAAASVQAPSAD